MPDSGLYQLETRAHLCSKFFALKFEMVIGSRCCNYIDENIDDCGQGMVSAANNQENDGGVKVLRQKDETKNKNEKKITETEMKTNIMFS